MLNAADWDKVTINVKDMATSPMVKAAEAMGRAFPGFTFGFPVPEEADEWAVKHWAILKPTDWPEFQEWNKRTPGVYGLREKDGALFFLSHLVAYRPTDFENKIRLAEQSAKEEHFHSRIREDSHKGAGVSFEEGGEEERVTIRKKPGRPKKT
jgi:hypothetical protein